jgi:hypothetical protein
VDGSELVFILMPIVIPLFLALGIAAPYIADSRANKRRRVYKKGKLVSINRRYKAHAGLRITDI